MAGDIVFVQRRIESINRQLEDGYNIDLTVIDQLQTDIEVVLEVVCQECEANPEEWESDCMMLVETMSIYNQLVTTLSKED